MLIFQIMLIIIHGSHIPNVSQAYLSVPVDLISLPPLFCSEPFLALAPMEGQKDRRVLSWTSRCTRTVAGSDGLKANGVGLYKGYNCM